MEFAHLENFVLLAEHLHYRRAAALTGVSASTLSRQINDLETDIGARLFERNRRGVRLTPAGEALLPEAREVLHRLRLAAAEARRAQAGQADRVRIGHGDAIALAVLQAALPALRRSDPDLRLQVLEAPSNRLAELVVADELDVALLRPPVRDGLVSERLCDERLVAVVPEASPLAARRRLRPADLVGQPLVLPDRNRSPGEHDTVVAALGPAVAAAGTIEEASTTSSLLLMVGAGLGAGLVPSAAVRHTEVSGVVAVPLIGTVTVELHVAWRPTDRRPSTAAALDAMRKAVAEVDCD